MTAKTTEIERLFPMAWLKEMGYSPNAVNKPPEPTKGYADPDVDYQPPLMQSTTWTNFKASISTLSTGFLQFASPDPQRFRKLASEASTMKEKLGAVPERMATVKETVKWWDGNAATRFEETYIPDVNKATRAHIALADSLATVMNENAKIFESAQKDALSLADGAIVALKDIIQGGAGGAKTELIILGAVATVVAAPLSATAAITVATVAAAANAGVNYANEERGVRGVLTFINDGIKKINDGIDNQEQPLVKAVNQNMDSLGKGEKKATAPPTELATIPTPDLKGNFRPPTAPIPADPKPLPPNAVVK